MMEPGSSGRCAMRAERQPPSLLAGAFFALAILAAGAFSGPESMAAEASPPPLPPEAEAAHQDLQGKSGVGQSSAENVLDEAIFTEISPLTIPETGIALPADQEH